jgi:hypothetical protein
MTFDTTNKSWSAITQEPTPISPQIIRTLDPVAPVSLPSEPLDVDMIDADSGYTSDEDSPEMKTLKKEHRHQSSAGLSPNRLAPFIHSSKAADTILQQGYTVRSAVFLRSPLINKQLR